MRRADPFDVKKDNVSDEATRTGGLYVSVVEGMCVDTVGITQGGAVHHVDPGANGRNGTSVPNNVIEVLMNVPNLLHDVHGSIGDFGSNF